MGRDTWVPIPGYDGNYKINLCTGEVCNSDGHIIKQTPSKLGPRVELRKPGLRDKLLVSELLYKVKGVNDYADG